MKKANNKITNINNNIKEEKNSYLEKIYNESLDVIQKNINKMPNIYNMISLPKFSNFSNALILVNYFKKNIQIKLKNINYCSRIKEELYHLLNKYITNYIINEKFNKNNKKGLLKLYSEFYFFISFCEIINSEYKNNFCTIIKNFIDILKDLFIIDFKYIALFIKILILLT